MTTSTTAASRPYDILLVGATGYTGALTAEHIAAHLPRDLKWAIAGRSREKLEKLAGKLRDIDPEREAPAIEVVQLGRKEVGGLVARVKVCICVVGVYPTQGEVVIEACVAQGTHYVDAAGDIPWIKEMIDKHESAAKENGVILVSAAGFCSAPQDLLARAVVSELEAKSSLKTKEVILSTVELTATPSGGSLLSIFNSFEAGDAETGHEAAQPWYLSSTKGGKTSDSVNLFGIRYDSDLGLLAGSPIGAAQNRAIVHRTWGLLDGGSRYGANFQYNDYMHVGTISGAADRLSSALLFGMLSFAPVRALAKRFVYAPGQGPDPAQSKKTRMEMQAVAVADQDSEKPARAFGKLTFAGGPYHITGLFLAQAAATMVYDAETVRSIGGGFVTPAILGESLVDRARLGGVSLETKLQ